MNIHDNIHKTGRGKCEPIGTKYAKHRVGALWALTLNKSEKSGIGLRPPLLGFVFTTSGLAGFGHLHCRNLQVILIVEYLLKLLITPL